MTANVNTLGVRSRIPAKSIALPVEHGAWGFLFEPSLAGLILAPSPAAPFILLMVVGAFLTRQPLKFLLGDLLQKRTLPRTAIARKFVLIFGVIAAVGFVGMLALAPSVAYFPFAVVAPLVVYLIAQDISRKTRELLPELLAAAALGASISGFALADGFTLAFSVALWLIMIARLIPSVLYVRARLRQEKGKPAFAAPTLLTHLAAAGIVAGLYFASLASILTVMMAAFLLARALYGLSKYRRSASAKAIGIREVVYGVIYALTIVIGYYSGI